MKNIILILFILFSLVLKSQEITDTIEVSYTKTAYLIFSEAPEIDKGSEDVIVRVFNNKVIIQAAVEGFEETNLFVQSGSNFYMFILKYSAAPKKYLFNYQVRSNSIGSTDVIQDSTSLKASGKKEDLINAYETKEVNIPKNNELIDYSVKNNQLEKVSSEKKTKTNLMVNCQWVDGKHKNIYDKGVLKDKISFIATNFYVNDEYFYLKLYINNTSKINYSIDFIRFTIKNQKIGIKKAADQYIELTPVYIYNDNVKSIPGKESGYKIFVFEKFTIEQNKKFNIEMWELNGDRKMNFDFYSKDVFSINRID